jgi:sulfur relay protein TusB/DsrH
MRIAFIITKTPHEEGFNSFIKLLNISKEQGTINLYLIGNGVYGATHGHPHAELIHNLALKHPVMVSEEDLLARGITSKNLIKGVKLFRDYGDFVEEIMEEMDQVLSF